MAWKHDNIIGFTTWKIYSELSKKSVKRKNGQWIYGAEISFKLDEKNTAEYEVLQAVRINLEGQFIKSRATLKKNGECKPGIEGIIEVDESYIDEQTIQFVFKVNVDSIGLEKHS